MLLACGGAAPLEPSSSSVRGEEQPCDPHEGTPLAVPDFLAQLVPEDARAACPDVERSIAGHGEGVPFPPTATMTVEEIEQACAQTAPECRAHCRGLLEAEVALRLYRRVQRGAYTLHGNFGQEACRERVASAPDVATGAEAHAIWRCMLEPIPERIELRLTMTTDDDGVRRIDDVVAAGSFAPSGTHPVELGLVREGTGCGTSTATWTLRGHPPGTGDECEEYDRHVCMAMCGQVECAFVRQFVPPP